MANTTVVRPGYRSAARPGTSKAVSKEDAQKRVLYLLERGSTISDACKEVKRSEETYRSWLKLNGGDNDFARAVRRIRSQQARTEDVERSTVPDFETFCRESLRQPLYQHQLRMLDVLEGSEPRDLHPRMVYRAGRGSRVIINVPPEHAKSTTFTVNWVTWLIHKDPNIKVAIVSEAKELAMDFLHAIKDRLTSEAYEDMHAKYAPSGGWKDKDQPWKQDRIFVNGKSDGEKDPTVQALGLESRIYGKRIDVLILDDTVSTKNVGEIAKQVRWLTKMALSRLPSEETEGWEVDEAERQNRVPGVPYGLCAVLGTRIAPQDLYQHLRDEFLDWEGGPLYTYFSQPAILERTEDDPSTWETLWPHTITASGKRRPKWGGRQLVSKMADLGSSDEWELVYQQADVAENADFPAGAVDCSINRARLHGPMQVGGTGARERGMAGLYVVGGLDLAAGGYTAAVVLGVDKLTSKRWILDLVNKKDMNASQIQALLPALTDKYGIREWVIEVNAMNRYVAQDPAIVQPLRARNVRIRPHTTGTNKTDPGFGVKSLAPLFLSCGELDAETEMWERTPDKALIDLPNPKICRPVGELISQLVTWRANAPKNQKTDTVMALWFAEIAARDYLGFGKRTVPTHMDNKFLSRRDSRTRRVVDLATLREEKLNAG